MSLISQRDRKLTIKALTFYLDQFNSLMSESERAETNALLKWIELEYQKNDN
jgi:hypothetical protein